MKQAATILSVYHADNPAHFRAAVESVVAQDLSGAIELRIYLAVDGPIPAELDAEITELSAHFFKVVRIVENQGLANALNVLISHLEDEEFIFRMDADDISLPGRYQAQIEYFDANPGIDILGTDIIEFDAETGLRRSVRFSRNSDEAFDRLYWRVPVAHPTVCFRRRVLDDIKKYPSVPFNEDIALWFQCAMRGYRFGNVPQPLYQFKIDKNFWKRRSFKKAYWEWRCYTQGAIMMHGWSWKLLLPALRFIIRVSPMWLQKIIYGLDFRRP